MILVNVYETKCEWTKSILYSNNKFKRFPFKSLVLSKCITSRSKSKSTGFWGFLQVNTLTLYPLSFNHLNSLRTNVSESVGKPCKT